MSSVSASLTKWFSERPQWLQIAATRLFQQSELTDKDVSELAALCQQEAGGKLPKTNCSFPATVFSQGVAGTLRLCSISDVEGVNALAPKKPLEFGKGNLTIVYGNNGSGKSGYVRLLKHVCGARETGTLHRNVYKPESAAQKACISFEQNGVPKSYTWSGQGTCDDLNSVDIFDTSFGNVFVSSEIVSIAAFLADVAGKSNQAPFVFDDPISSLDQSYEEAVVQRLIELSQDKQIIIFTHRLSLLGTVRHFAEKKAIKPDVVSIRSVDWGTGEPAPIPLSQSDIKSALNALMNQRYQDAKNASENGEFEYAEILLKSVCRTSEHWWSALLKMICCAEWFKDSSDRCIR